MATGFEAVQPKTLPTFLQDAQGQAFAAMFGRAKDGQDGGTGGTIDGGLLWMKQAAAARWPNSAMPYWAPEALSHIGRDRRILRAPTELPVFHDNTTTAGDVAYAARLLAAPDTWESAGTPAAMQAIFAPYGYTPSMVSVVANHQGLATVDGNTTWFSRFAIYLSAQAGVGAPRWDARPLNWVDPGTNRWDIGSPWSVNYWVLDTPWDTPIDTWSDTDGTKWDTSITDVDLDYIRSSIRELKAPGSFPMLLQIALDTSATPAVATFPLGRTWDDSTNWLGGSVELWSEDTSSSAEMWEDDVYVAPSAGWDLRT